MTPYVLVSGEIIRYRDTDPAVSSYLDRVVEAAGDIAVTARDLLTLIHSPENPLVDAVVEADVGTGRDHTTHPVYRVMLDQLERKVARQSGD